MGVWVRELWAVSVGKISVKIGGFVASSMIKEQREHKIQPRGRMVRVILPFLAESAERIA